MEAEAAALLGKYIGAGMACTAIELFLSRLRVRSHYR